MKSVISVLALFIVLATTEALKAKEVCSFAPDTGMCRAYIPMYHYDRQSGQCKQFIYGGCDGNENRFSTIEECEKSCEFYTKVDYAICRQPVQRGMCLAYMPRYHFNKNGECEQFIYGGCGGNDNNFATMQECQRRCPLI